MRFRKNREKVNRRGLSAIVAVVLIILVSIAGVGIVWGVILPMFEELSYFGYSDVKLSLVTDSGYTVYDPVKNFAFVQVSRGNDDKEMVAVEFLFDLGGDFVKYRNREVPFPNSKKTYKFNFTRDGIVKVPIAVSISPVFLVDGRERIGEVLSKIDIPSQEVVLDDPENSWKKADEESGGSVIRIVDENTGGEVDKVDEVEESKGSYLTFNGVDSYLTISGGDAVGFGIGDFSISWWGTIPGVNQNIFHSEQGSMFDLSFYRQYDGNITFSAGGGMMSPHYITINSSDISLDFAHYVCVREGSDLRIYVNGLNKLGFLFFFQNSGIRYLSPSKFTIGASTYYEYSVSNFFNGSLDDFRIYKKALNQTEIDTIYNNGKGTKVRGDEEGLSWASNFDSLSGDIVVDVVDGVNGTLVGNIEDDMWVSGGVPF